MTSENPAVLVFQVSCNFSYSKALWAMISLKLQQLLKQQRPADDSLAPLPAFQNEGANVMMCWGVNYMIQPQP